MLKVRNLGHLSIVIKGWPRIFAVNHAAGEGAILLRTAPGAKLERGLGSAACFEVDGYEGANLLGGP